MRVPSTVEQVTKAAVAAMTGKAPEAQAAPDAIQANQGAALASHAERPAQLLAQIQQRHSGKASVSRHSHRALARNLAYPPSARRLPASS